MMILQVTSLTSFSGRRKRFIHLKNIIYLLIFVLVHDGHFEIYVYLSHNVYIHTCHEK